VSGSNLLRRKRRARDWQKQREKEKVRNLPRLQKNPINHRSHPKALYDVIQIMARVVPKRARGTIIIITMIPLPLLQIPPCLLPHPAVPRSPVWNIQMFPATYHPWFCRMFQVVYHPWVCRMFQVSCPQIYHR